MSARLFDPPLFIDREARQGEVIADRTIAAIRAGATNPDALMAALLGVIAECGRQVPPAALLRGFCGAVQRELSGGRDDAT